MLADKLFDRFEQDVLANPDLYLEDYYRVKDSVANSTAIYKNKPIDFLYQPMFFCPDDIQRLGRIAHTLAGILEKVIDQYCKDSQFRKLFAFSPLMEELILIDPGYRWTFPMARFDLFYHRDDKDIRFCELNADGSSGMNEVRELHNIVGASQALSGFDKGQDFVDMELFDTWIDAIIANYREFGHGPETPNIAIADFTGEGTTSEFEVFRSRFEARGYDTVICDLQELKLQGTQLYYGSMPIHLVYRRATTTRIVHHAANIKDFIRAYREKYVCVVGGMVSQIIHNKKLFAVLHMFQHLTFLNSEEKDFIAAHIPYTVMLHAADKEFLAEVAGNKDRWVLKPDDQFAAHGVFIGKYYSRHRWQQLVKQWAGESYLAQEFCSLPQRKMLTVEGRSLRFENYNFMLGLFMYNHRFRGIFTRASRHNTIAAVVESFALPNFILNK